MLTTLKKIVGSILGSLRRVAGSLFQIVFHDKISDLQRQTQRLGSASVESATYLGSEVRGLEERLSAIERELASLRELLERDDRAGSAEADDEIAARPHAR